MGLNSSTGKEGKKDPLMLTSLESSHPSGSKVFLNDQGHLEWCSCPWQNASGGFIKSTVIALCTKPLVTWLLGCSTASIGTMVLFLWNRKMFIGCEWEPATRTLPEDCFVHQQSITRFGE